MLDCLSLVSEMRAPAVYTFFISFVLFAGSSFYNKNYFNPNKVEKNSSGLKVSMGLKDRKKYEIEDWVTRNKKFS